MRTGDELLAAAEQELEPIKSHAFGGDVYLARMNADQSDAMYVCWRDQPTTDTGWRAFVVAWCLCDESGSPLFRDVDGDERLQAAWRRFRKCSASTVDRLFEIAAKANGILPADTDEQLEGAAKN